MKKLNTISIILLTANIFLSGCGGIPFVDKSKRQEIFNGKIIHVYPVHVLKAESHFDTTLSNHIVRYLNGIDRLKAEMVNKPIEVNSTWEMNEAKMFMNSFNAFAKSVKADSEKVEYALLVELLCQPNKMIGVHYYLLDNKESKAVMGHIINSHNENYQRISPKNEEDGLKVFESVFNDDVAELKGGN